MISSKSVPYRSPFRQAARGPPPKTHLLAAAAVVLVTLWSIIHYAPLQDFYYNSAIPIHRYDKIRGSTGNIGQYAIRPLSSLLRSHRRHPHARDVSVHFVNHHFGTMSELRAISQAVGKRNHVKITVNETWGIYDAVRSFYVTKEASDDYWPRAQAEECNAEKYDMVISGDTMSLMRPHLQNCCPLKLVSLLTTRYDWAHDESDVDWTNLLVNASRWNNYRIYPNNLIESWYSNWKEGDILMQDYLPSSGIPSDLWTEALQTSNISSSNSIATQKKADAHELVIPLSVRTEECLLTPLNQANVNYTTYERNTYGGPYGLTDRVMVHFPYQSNTMSLFENLHQRVIYVLPTLRLYREMGVKCKARLESIPSYLLSDEEFYTRVDWWRRDLQHLFYYFDSFDELQEDSPLRKRIVQEADEKHRLIEEYMIRQREYVLEQWEDIFFGKWDNKEGQADSQCHSYRTQHIA
jgi:hypothetical protein